MQEIKIWHNPRCAKSRAALKLLKEHGIEPQIYDYKKNPPSEKEILALLKKLELPAERLIRKKEKIYKELKLADKKDQDKLIKAMSEHPGLIERPIIEKGSKAVIGRPIENVIDFLGLDVQSA